MSGRDCVCACMWYGSEPKVLRCVLARRPGEVNGDGSLSSRKTASKRNETDSQWGGKKRERERERGNFTLYIMIIITNKIIITIKIHVLLFLWLHRGWVLLRNGFGRDKKVFSSEEESVASSLDTVRTPPAHPSAGLIQNKRIEKRRGTPTGRGNKKKKN